MKPITKLSILLVACMWLAGCNRNAAEHAQDETASASTGHADHAPATPEVMKGPHRGRLLQDGAFTVELAIFETGVPPEFRAWSTLAGKAIAATDVNLLVEVTRLGDVKDQYRFKPTGQAPDDFLQAQTSVYEPHSFVVNVQAEHAGKTHLWSYESYEGRTSIAAKIAEEAGVKTELAGPAELSETTTLYGEITANPERQREVSARFPGVLRSVSKGLGDTVKAGETLASVESNESLRSYAITAPLSGVLTQRDANVGEQTGDRVLFTITDTSAVLAELSVFARDRMRVQVGAEVMIKLADANDSVSGKILRIDSQADANQAVKARVAMENTRGQFLPGSFITAQVVVAKRSVPLAVKASGLQPFRDFTVVYAQVGESYEVRMLELGAQNGDWVEVLGGLKPGTRYVTENSYLIKADVEKSAASHDH
jgi:membrane fusion protein, heavy metal efflux system